MRLIHVVFIAPVCFVLVRTEGSSLIWPRMNTAIGAVISVFIRVHLWRDTRRANALRLIHVVFTCLELALECIGV